MSRIFVVALFFFLMATSIGVAWAEPQIQLLDPQGNPIPITNMQVQPLTLTAGEVYSGTVSAPTTISGNVANLYQRVDDAGETHFEFTVPKFQTELIIGTGQSATTFLIQPAQATLPLGLDPLNVALIIGIAIAVVIVAWVVKRKLEHS